MWYSGSEIVENVSSEHFFGGWIGGARRPALSTFSGGWMDRKIGSQNVMGGHGRGSREDQNAKFST